MKLKQGRYKMKILSMSDVHLDTFNSFATPTDNIATNSRLENILWAMEKAFKTGQDQGVGGIVINGDLFNQRTKINPNTYSYCIQKVVELFRTNSAKGVTLYINVGNHDEQGRNLQPNSVSIFTSFSTKEHPIVVVKQLAQLVRLQDNTAIMLVPFTEDIETSKRAINDTLGVITHNKLKTAVFAHLGVVGGVQGRWNHKLSGEYNLADLGWNHKYITNIILGHFHNKNILKENKQKRAWYQGDLTELNFNDVNEDGSGADRGFDIIDTETSEITFYNLADKLPRFMIYDLKDKFNLDDLVDSMEHNYVKLVVHDKEAYKKITKAYQEQHDSTKPYANILLKIEPKQEQDLDIEATDSDSDILSAYMDKFYPDDESLKQTALAYLNKVE